MPPAATEAQRFVAETYGERATILRALGAGAWSQAYAFTLDGEPAVIRFGHYVDDFRKDQAMAPPARLLRAHRPGRHELQRLHRAMGRPRPQREASITTTPPVKRRLPKDRGVLPSQLRLSYISFSFWSGPMWGRGRALPAWRQRWNIGAVITTAMFHRCRCRSGAGSGPVLRAGVPWRARLMGHAGDRAESRPGPALPEPRRDTGRNQLCDSLDRGGTGPRSWSA